MKKFSLLVSLLVFLTFSQGAKAVLIDFDDVVVNSYGYRDMDYTYHNATWTGFWVIDPYIANTNYIPAIVSPNNVAVNVYGGDASIAFNTPVYLGSAYFTSSYYAPNVISVSGTYFDGSSFSFDDIITLNPIGNKQFETFSFLGNKSVSYITFSPTPTPAYPYPKVTDKRPWFGMDDFTYTPVPEPSSMALGLMSLAGLLGARRKKK